MAVDGVTMLPTFMPVATQAAIKGLTPQQVEGLGITLILNNTYHLNLRPGVDVLKEAGGAHKFQGWRRNLLTVRPRAGHVWSSSRAVAMIGQRGLPACVAEQVHDDHGGGRTV